MKKTIIVVVFMAACAISFGQQPKDGQKAKQDTVYALAGKIGDFQALYRAVSSPGDITPNQVKAILEWLQTVRAFPVTDTAKKK